MIMPNAKQFFLNLCTIPRPSGGEAAVVDYLFQTLTDFGYAPERDAANNLRCCIPATIGCDDVPCVALQAHTDMVCVAAPGADYRPGLDPVKTVEQDGWLCSDGRSTLGADNGAAVAIMLSIAQQPPEKHGAILLLFTTAEEQGMVGVREVSPKWLEGVSYLINLDSFQSSPAICGSAGGLRQSWSRNIEREPLEEGNWLKISLSNLTGGHSGYDIHQNRGNAVTLLAKFLRMCPCRVASFNGGSNFNAIPTWAEAVVAVADKDAFRASAQAWRAHLFRHYHDTDPDFTGALTDAVPEETAWSAETADDVLSFLTALPQGVVAWFPDGSTADSGNPAVVRTDGDAVTVQHFARASTMDMQEQTETKTAELAEQSHFTRIQRTSYNPWEPAENNTLFQLVQRCYLAQHGSELGAERVHVGLECALLLEKAPDMQVIALGCNIKDAHAVTERMELASFAELETLLRSTLQTIAEEETR
jgi:dipeptidase D